MLPKQTDTTPLQRRLPNAVPSETERAGSRVWQYLLRTMSQNSRLHTDAEVSAFGGDGRSGQAPSLPARRVVGCRPGRPHPAQPPWGLGASVRGQTSNPRPEPRCSPICQAGGVGRSKDANLCVHRTPAFHLQSSWGVGRAAPPFPAPSGCQMGLLGTPSDCLDISGGTHGADTGDRCLPPTWPCGA